MEELSKSLKYVPAYKIKERYEKKAEEKGIKKGENDKAKEMARVMKKEAYPIDEIIKLTGLTKATINRLKIE